MLQALGFGNAWKALPVDVDLHVGFEFEAPQNLHALM